MSEGTPVAKEAKTKSGQATACSSETSENLKKRN